MTNMDLLRRMEMSVAVELGTTRMALADVMALGEGGTVVLDRMVDEPLDLSVNGTVIARGEVVAENGRFGLRIVEVTGDGAVPPAPAEAVATEPG